MVELKDWAAVTYAPAILNDPPIGFCYGYLAPVPGTWRQVLPPAN